MGGLRCGMIVGSGLGNWGGEAVGGVDELL